MCVSCPGNSVFLPQKCHNDLLDTCFLAAQDCSWGGQGIQSVFFPKTIAMWDWANTVSLNSNV